MFEQTRVSNFLSISGNSYHPPQPPKWVEAESQESVQSRAICNFTALADYHMCILLTLSQRSSWNGGGASMRPKTLSLLKDGYSEGCVRPHFSLSISFSLALSLSDDEFSEALFFTWPNPAASVPPATARKELTQGEGVMSAAHKKPVWPVLFGIKLSVSIT